MFVQTNLRQDRPRNIDAPIPQEVVRQDLPQQLNTFVSLHDAHVALHAVGAACLLSNSVIGSIHQALEALPRFLTCVAVSSMLDSRPPSPPPVSAPCVRPEEPPGIMTPAPSCAPAGTNFDDLLCREASSSATGIVHTDIDGMLCREASSRASDANDEQIPQLFDIFDDNVLGTRLDMVDACTQTVMESDCRWSDLVVAAAYTVATSNMFDALQEAPRVDKHVEIPADAPEPLTQAFADHLAMPAVDAPDPTDSICKPPRSVWRTGKGKLFGGKRVRVGAEAPTKPQIQTIDQKIIGDTIQVIPQSVQVPQTQIPVTVQSAPSELHKGSVKPGHMMQIQAVEKVSETPQIRTAGNTEHDTSSWIQENFCGFRNIFQNSRTLLDAILDQMMTPSQFSDHVWKCSREDVISALLCLQRGHSRHIHRPTYVEYLGSRGYACLDPNKLPTDVLKEALLSCIVEVGFE